MRNHVWVGAATLALSFGMTAARASVVVSNLSDAQAGRGGIYQGAHPQSWAQQFTTGDQAYILTDIIVPLGNSGVISPTAQLLTDSGSDTPGGTVLTTFTIPTIPTSGTADITLTPTSAVELAANTSYWLLLSGTSTSGGRYQWAYTAASETGLTRFAYTWDGGATYTTSTDSPFLMQVDGTAADASDVPEPASWAMITVGFAGVGAALRCRRSAKRAVA